MKQKLPLIAAMLVLGGRACMAQSAIAPDVIASAGNYYVNSTASLSWTIGEPITATVAYLTQGFQQPVTIVVTNVTDPSSLTGNVSAFPNPLISTVYLQNNDEGKTLQVELVSIEGKTLFTK